MRDSYLILGLRDLVASKEDEGSKEDGDRGSDSGVSELGGSSTGGSGNRTPEPWMWGVVPRGQSRSRRGSSSSVAPRGSLAGRLWSGLLLVTGVLLLLWLGDHVVCCEHVCAINISPILKYTNGPPPL